MPPHSWEESKDAFLGNFLVLDSKAGRFGMRDAGFASPLDLATRQDKNWKYFFEKLQKKKWSRLVPVSGRGRP